MSTSPDMTPAEGASTPENRPPARDVAGGLERPLLFGSVALISLVAFETLAVTTAMPTVARDLGGMSLYALAFGVSLAAQLFTTPLAGYLADRYGPRRPLLLGLGLFLVGLVICGVAPTMGALVLGRLVQGLGAGFLVVPLYVLVGALVPPERRPAFFAAFAAAWVVPSMIGPPVAGLVVEQASWRWVFLGVPPLIVLATLLLAPVLRRVPGPTAAGGAEAGGSANGPAEGRRGTRRLILSALGAAVASALLQSLSARSGAASVTALPLGTVLLGVVALVLLGSSLPALLPPGTLRLARGLPSVVGARALLNGAFVAVDVFLPLMLQQVHGWRPTAAGLVLTVGAITWAMGSALQARVTDPGTRHRMVAGGPWVIVLGMAVTAVAVLGPAWLALVGWGVAGLGIGMAFPALSVIALEVTPPARHGSMSSSLQIADTLGAALSLALVGAIFSVFEAAGAWAFLAGIAISALLAVLAGVAGSRTRVESPARSQKPEISGS